MDRRVQFSQQKLVDALRVLMQRYPWENITIATICQESALSRSTFYSHFSSKEALMQFSLESLARELAPTDTRRGLDANRTLKFVPAFLSHIKRHRDILEKNRDTVAEGVILRNLRQTVNGLLLKELQDSSLSTSISHESFIFICGGLMAIVEKWNDDGCNETVEFMVGIIDSQLKRALEYFQGSTV